MYATGVVATESQSSTLLLSYKVPLYTVVHNIVVHNIMILAVHLPPQYILVAAVCGALICTPVSSVANVLLTLLPGWGTLISSHITKASLAAHFLLLTNTYIPEYIPV
jgi:hypothetical protein